MAFYFFWNCSSTYQLRPISAGQGFSCDHGGRVTTAKLTRLLQSSVLISKNSELIVVSMSAVL